MVAFEKWSPTSLCVRRWQTLYDGQRDVIGRAGLILSRTASAHAVQLKMLGFARLARVAACYSEVSWVVPTRVLRPKPL